MDSDFPYGIKLKFDVMRSNKYRSELIKTKNQQLAIMSLTPGQTIPAEIHDVDQFIYIVAGSGSAIINNLHYNFSEGDALIIPAETQHEIINSSSSTLKLFTVYSPPEEE